MLDTGISCEFRLLLVVADCDDSLVLVLTRLRVSVCDTIVSLQVAIGGCITSALAHRIVSWLVGLWLQCKHNAMHTATGRKPEGSVVVI